MGMWTQQERMENFDVHINLARRENPQRIELGKLSPESPTKNRPKEKPIE